MRPHIEARRRANGSARVVFLYPKKAEFAAAARTLKIRKLMSFGRDPIPGRYGYKAFYADIDRFDAETYGKYAMLVRDFYASDLQAKFNELFPGLEHAGIESSIHNPNAYMEAHRKVIDHLISKYKDSTSPLEFYGSKHMAEGVALLLDCLRHPEMKGGILADEQGMAKTIQVIIAALEAGMKRIMVVAPVTARATSWPSEIRKVNKDLSWSFGNPNQPGSRNVQFEMFTWDDLRRMPGMAEIYALEDRFRENGKLSAADQEKLAYLRESVGTWASKFDLILADEAHRAKHEGSQRSTALRNIAAHVPRIIPMTGTPITKYPKNVLHLLKLIRHPLAANPAAFMARYNPEKGPYNKTQPVSKQRLEELHALLRDCYIRREKSQTNLPPKTRYIQKVEIDDAVMDGLEERWEAYCNEYDEKKGMTRRELMKKESYPLDLVYTMKMREFVSRHKLKAVFEWADDLIEADEKVVIFTQFTETFDAIMKYYGSSAVGIDGRTPTHMRTKAKDAFQTDDKIKVFAGQYEAAGESITLTASSNWAGVDLPWLPTTTLQAEDRICRGGQTKPCSMNFFLSDHEVDVNGFKDFIKYKGVVQTITNRRDEKGEIHDAEWKGDVEGTGIQEQLEIDRSQAGGEFDWEDAGEDPPADEKPQDAPPRGRDLIERAKLKAQADAARRAGTVFGGTAAPADRRSGMNVLKSELPEGRGGDAIIHEELTQLQKFLVGWDVEFSKSIIAWVQGGKRLSEKQRTVAMKIIAKNRRHLVGRKP